MSHDPRTVANAFLALSKKRDVQATRLQILVYLAHGWHLAITGRPLAQGRIEAGDTGPAFVMLPTACAPGRRPGGKFFSLADGMVDDTPLTSEAREIIAAVRLRYGAYDKVALLDMVMTPGTPWANTYFGKGRRARILDADIEAYFIRLAKAGRTAKASRADRFPASGPMEVTA